MSYSRQITVTCENNSSADCTVEAALSIIGGKWKLKIYKSLKSGKPLRFSLLFQELRGISEKTLTAQLREMEKDGIITRVIYAEIPPRVEYQLTALGYSLDKVFNSLDTWGRAYIDLKGL